MEEPLDSLIAAVGSLTARVDELQSRLRKLEESHSRLELDLGLQPAPEPKVSVRPATVVGESSGFVAPLGIAFLGLAAAFMLRALSEMQAIPQALGVGLAVAYSLGWLVYAARSGPRDGFAAAIRATTGFMILGPVVWEAQTRFHSLDAWASATVLVLFTCAGVVVSWQQNRSIIAWIAVLTGLATPAALLWATRNLLPYSSAILIVALVVEGSAVMGHRLHERWAAAGFANVLVLLLTDLVLHGAPLPDGYSPMPAAVVRLFIIALPLVYGIVTLIRTLFGRREITIFEIVQCPLSAAIACYALVSSAGRPEWLPAAIGGVLLSGSMGAYALSLGLLAHDEGRRVSQHAYATFGLFMAVAGAALAFGSSGLAVTSVVVALMSAAIGRRAPSGTVRWHAVAYMAVGALASGLLAHAQERLFGSGLHSQPEGELRDAWLLAAASTAAFAAAFRAAPSSPGGWTRSTPTALLALMAGACCLNAVAYTVGGTCPQVHAAGEVKDFCPAILTALMSVAVLGLAWLALRSRQPALLWPAYALTWALTWKLLVQDIRFGSAIAMVVSLLAYGATLVILPRLVRLVKATVALTE